MYGNDYRLFRTYIPTGFRTWIRPDHANPPLLSISAIPVKELPLANGPRPGIAPYLYTPTAYPYPDFVAQAAQAGRAIPNPMLPRQQDSQAGWSWPVLSAVRGAIGRS